MEKLIQNGGGDYNMICHCDYCHYTFDPADYHMAEQLPERCPDCGKLTAHGHPAVRIATEAEIMDYRQIQMELNEEESHAAGKEAAGYESDSYISHGANLRQSHVRL